MMTLYSGTTCPFSHRCRIVLYEKGMDFQILDVDLMNKPEDLAIMNPYNRTPVLVERDFRAAHIEVPYPHREVRIIGASSLSQSSELR